MKECCEQGVADNQVLAMTNYESRDSICIVSGHARMTPASNMTSPPGHLAIGEMCVQPRVSPPVSTPVDSRISSCYIFSCTKMNEERTQGERDC